MEPGDGGGALGGQGAKRDIAEDDERSDLPFVGLLPPQDAQGLE